MQAGLAGTLPTWPLPLWRAATFSHVSRLRAKKSRVWHLMTLGQLRVAVRKLIVIIAMLVSLSGHPVALVGDFLLQQCLCACTLLRQWCRIFTIRSASFLGISPGRCSGNRGVAVVHIPSTDIFDSRILEMYRSFRAGKHPVHFGINAAIFVSYNRIGEGFTFVLLVLLYLLSRR
jgi:hypothetical protein